MPIALYADSVASALAICWTGSSVAEMAWFDRIFGNPGSSSSYRYNEGDEYPAYPNVPRRSYGGWQGANIFEVIIFSSQPSSICYHIYYLFSVFWGKDTLEHQRGNVFSAPKLKATVGDDSECCSEAQYCKIFGHRNRGGGVLTLQRGHPTDLTTCL